LTLKLSHLGGSHERKRTYHIPIAPLLRGTPDMKRALGSGRHIIAFHYPCPDGIFAALAATLHFRQRGVPVHYAPNRVFAPCTVESLQLTADDSLYMLDFVGPPGFAVAAAKVAGRAAAPHNLEINLDVNMSGATIALQYFQPKISEDQSRMFKLIEDADLWRWVVPDSLSFHAGFGALGLEFDVLKNANIFEQLLSLKPDDVITYGREVQERIDRQIAEAVATSFPVNLGGERGEGWGQCLAVQAPPGSPLGAIRSQLGNVLVEESARRGLRSMAVVAYNEPEMTDLSKIKCSVRSTGDEDTTVISKQFGGGGHLNASSFVIDLSEFTRWRVT